MRKITKIEASGQLGKRKRVAAYARVSSGKDAMLHSLSAQISYYNSYIGSRGDWQLAGIYADEAQTGTKEDRPEFQRMLKDCREGKIDMIITKSLTRFARNTVTLLKTVRELKLLEVDVYFEKENIHTLSSDGELMLTLLASFAQEESRSVSENQKWRIRRMFEQGRPNTGRMLGYRLVDGVLQIIPEEAAIVKMIFDDYLSGMSKNAIMKKLIRMKIPPLRSAEWRENTIHWILRNEKYKGDALLQKTYTVDFLSKRVKKNNGEITQYYIQNSHPAIIDPDTFELVQNEIKRRRPGRRQLHKNSPFTAKIVCDECGSFYGRKVWHSKSKYRSYIWRCNGKYESDHPCTTPNLREADVEEAFVEAFNKLLGDKEQYVTRFEETLPLLADTCSLEGQLADLENRHIILKQNLQAYMEANTRIVQNQTEYNQRFSQMEAECVALERSMDEVKKKILAQQGRKEQIWRCLEELRHCDSLLDEFRLDLWNSMVESVTVTVDGVLKFRFRDGTVIPISMPKK